MHHWLERKTRAIEYSVYWITKCESSPQGLKSRNSRCDSRKQWNLVRVHILRAFKAPVLLRHRRTVRRWRNHIRKRRQGGNCRFFGNLSDPATNSCTVKWNVVVCHVKFRVISRQLLKRIVNYITARLTHFRTSYKPLFNQNFGVWWENFNQKSYNPIQ